MSQTEMQAFAGKISLTLLNDIIAFVREASDADNARKRAVQQECIFLYGNTGGGALQEKYGFLYLGELLERYETRFGLPIQDLRAIALGLAYTRDLVSGSMFVGAQREDFLRRVRREAEDDLYLAGALYLLNRGLDGAAIWEERLLGRHDSTEDQIFALSLLPSAGPAFQRCSPQLLRLLGPDRTMPVLGNMRTLAWLFGWLQSAVKKAKGRNMALFRALATLPSAFVKKDCKHHAVLLEQGYSSFEIAYANMMTVLLQTPGDVLRQDSITAQKIAVELFWEILAHKEPFPAEAYAQFTEIFKRYLHFSPRCYGCKTMPEALQDAPQASNAGTFIWFAGQAGITHPTLGGFDVMDTAWDALAAGLPPEDYLFLFEAGLTENLEQADVRNRIERYDALTGTSYLAGYWTDRDLDRFGLLVKKDIFDLWELFQKCLDSEGAICQPVMMRYIRSALKDFKTVQAYRFYQKFMEELGAQKLNILFENDTYGDLYLSLVKDSTDYRGINGGVTLAIDRDFLDDDGRRQVLEWLEAYIFLQKPEKYLLFITAILLDKSIAALFSEKDQQALFSLVIRCPSLPAHVSSRLKERYFTPEELQAEAEAAEADRQKEEQRARLEQERHIREKYAGENVCSFSSARRFLKHIYTDDEERIASQIIYENLNAFLPEKEQKLDIEEAVCMFSVFETLLTCGCMSFQEAQRYILQIDVKESEEDVREEE